MRARAEVLPPRHGRRIVSRRGGRGVRRSRGSVSGRAACGCRRSGRRRVPRVGPGGALGAGGADPGPPPAPPALPGPWPPSGAGGRPVDRRTPPDVVSALTVVPVRGVRRPHLGAGQRQVRRADLRRRPGPESAAVLRHSEDAGVAATFFDIGVNETVRPDIVRAGRRAGLPAGQPLVVAPEPADAERVGAGRARWTGPPHAAHARGRRPACSGRRTARTTAPR